MAKLDFEQFVNLKLLLNVEGIGSGRMRQLVSKFNSFDNILSADLNSLIEVEQIRHTTAKKILSISPSQREYIRDKTEKELLELDKICARYITFWDDEYPEILRNIYDPPIILYCQGAFEISDECAIAVVGTRNPTYYGKLHAEKFTEALSRNKITIVSGLARGVDSIAHRTALKHANRSIAVLGTGLDVTYPPENQALCSEIAEKGVVITEYEIGAKPDPQNFPRRNRIISGLSIGVLIVESAVSGGAMQTAAYAFDQNKEVFAIPGNLGSVKSEGPNALIQMEKAKLVTSADDILKELEFRMKPAGVQAAPKPEIQLNLFEEKLVQCLDNEPKHIDKISTESNMTVSDCLVYLLSLEFKGVVKQYPGKTFSLI